MTEAQRIAAYESAIAALWQADAAHDMGHLRRVWRIARLIAMDEPGADAEILLAAAYFHDAVNLPKDSPDRSRASTLSADLAIKVLPQYEADEGALSKAQLSQIKKSAPKAKGGTVRSSLFEVKGA